MKIKNNVISVVVSDSHGDNDAMTWLKHHYDPSKVIFIHAGDHLENANFMNREFTHWVDGNNDMGSKDKLIFYLKDLKAVLTHGHLQYAITKSRWIHKLGELAKANDAKIVIFGHSHIPEISEQDGIIFLNPGSVSEPRAFPFKKTYMTIEEEGGRIVPVIRNLFDE